jgi:hypothetical protein
MLSKTPLAIHQVKGTNMDVVFEDDDDHDDKNALDASKFQNVKRLIEVHWLEGVPLRG